MKNKAGIKAGRSFLASVLLFIFIFTMAGCSKNGAEGSKSAKNGEDTAKKVATKVEDGKVYVSMKEAFEYIGGKCTVDGKSAAATKDKDTVKVDSSSKEATLNESKISMSHAPKVISNDVYVPMEFLNEVMDARVSYDKEGKFLRIRTEMPLSYTKAFSVKYLKGGVKKVIDGEKRTLILVPEGKEAPKEYKDGIVIKTPIKNVLLGSTTQACLLRPIGELSSVSQVTNPAKQWQIDEVKKGVEGGKITFVGDNKAPDYEKISASKPQVAFVYTGPYGLQPMIKKLDELKVNYAVDNEYLEEDPFGRMEWMKFIAAFYDKEDEAEKYFNESVKKVDDVRKKAASGKKPKVAWGMVSKGEVYVPKTGSYVAKMIEMAGGDYMFKDAGSGAGSGKISLEEFYAKAKDADVLIYSSTQACSPTLEGVVKQAPALEKLNAVKNKNVWCFHPDYWQSLDKTDELIIDLAGVFHPENKGSNNIKHYIKYEK